MMAINIICQHHVFAQSNFYLYLCNDFEVGDGSPLFCYIYNTMINAGQIKDLLQSELEQKGLFVVEATVRPGNKIILLIDSMKGVTIDECANLSRFLEQKLDRSKE